jgi:hypothetical protein
MVQVEPLFRREPGVVLCAPLRRLFHAVDGGQRCSGRVDGVGKPRSISCRRSSAGAALSQPP